MDDEKIIFQYNATEIPGSKNLVIIICIILENVQIEKALEPITRSTSSPYSYAFFFWNKTKASTCMYGKVRIFPGNMFYLYDVWHITCSGNLKTTNVVLVIPEVLAAVCISTLDVWGVHDTG